MTDMVSLEHYLQQEETEQEQQHFNVWGSSLDTSSTTTPQGSPPTSSSWFGSSYVPTHTPSPRKYRIAPRSNSPSAHYGEHDSPCGRSPNAVSITQYIVLLVHYPCCM